MLIVNADDYGRNPVATDRILITYRENRITSASAMVFMGDSERAAEMAKQCSIPLGLHINLTEKFTSPAVPPSIANAQARVRSFLKLSKYALIIYHPFLRRLFRTLLDAQRSEFARLFGRPPCHFDGHQHMHLATNILFDKLLPEGSNVRRNFTFTRSEKGSASKVYRNLVDRALAKRHVLTEEFYSLTHYMNIEHLSPIVFAARSKNIELMTHPEWDKDFEFLRKDSYGKLISQVPTGSRGLSSVESTMLTKATQ